ncbi:GTPase [Methanobacterium sp.]|uniref:GTPase n=1 Tax=Methanobacterium sp. TaxID=2164 RepID=UPI003C72F09E
MEVKKIIVLGDSDSGKTTALEHICENLTKTTALDYGKTLINGKKTYFFCSPGNKRFAFMQDIISKNLDGAIIFIDITIGITKNNMKLIRFIEEKRVPYVIFANKRDISNKPLDIDVNAPIILTNAITGQGIKNGLERLFKLMNNERAKFKQIAVAA